MTGSSRANRAYHAWAAMVHAEYHGVGHEQFHEVITPEHLDVIPQVALALAHRGPAHTWNPRQPMNPAQALALTVAMANADVVPVRSNAAIDAIVDGLRRQIIAVADTEQRAALAGVQHLGGTTSIGLRPWVGLALADAEATVPRAVLADVARVCQFSDPRVEWVRVPHLGWATYYLGTRGAPWRPATPSTGQEPEVVLFPGCTVHMRREPLPDGSGLQLVIAVRTTDGSDPALLDEHGQPRVMVQINDTVVRDRD